MVAGSGDPTQRMVVLDPLASNPRCGTATTTELLTRVMVLSPLSASDATTAWPVAMLVAAPRRLSIRIVTVPDGGVVKLKPLRLTT